MEGTVVEKDQAAINTMGGMQDWGISNRPSLQALPHPCHHRAITRTEGTAVGAEGEEGEDTRRVKGMMD